MKIIRQFVSKISEINERYAKPKVEMSPLIKLSLTGLRIYLLVLVLLLIYKFITVLPVGK
jgi:hypothetical protein